MAVDIFGDSEWYRGLDTHWGFGPYLFTRQGNELDHSRKADAVDGSTYGSEWKDERPGQREGSLKIKGTAAMKRGRITQILNSEFGRDTPSLAWFATEGLAVGDPITMQPSSLMDHSLSTKMKDPVEFDAELKARGACDDGFIMLSPKALLSGASGMGLVDIADTATQAGGVAQLHVWAFEGGTTPELTVELEQSVDGTVWTPLVTFAGATEVGAWRIKIPFTTTINAQVRASWEVTGTPDEVQVLCGLARGIDLSL